MEQVLLKETPAERGCFGGCLFTMFIGGACSALIGWVGTWWYSKYLAQSSNDESFMLLKFMVAIVCFVLGGILSGIISYMVSHKRVKDEEEVL